MYSFLVNIFVSTLGLDRRYQEQNGGLSSTQLAWLDKELSDSDTKHERVFVFGHCCMHPDSCEPTCLVWNYDEVMSVMGRHPSVVAYLSGTCKNAKTSAFLVAMDNLNANCHLN